MVGINMTFHHPLLFIALTGLCGCQTQKTSNHASILTFSPATLAVGVRTEKEWKENGFILTGTGNGEKSFMGSVSAIGSEKPTPAGYHSPVNGTDYISFLTSHVRDGSIYRQNKSTFTPKSVDLAEYSTVFPAPQPILFYGLKPDGHIVACAFVTDGVIDGPGGQDDFQTFYFPKSFKGLTILSWCVGKFSMDNLKLE